MQQRQTQTNINQLLQALPETNQEVVRGGRQLSSSGTYYTGSVTVSSDD